MENYTSALCYTLIHSLWQGIVLAGITGMVIVFTGRSTAAKRYLLLVSTLVLFFVTTLGTFYYELNQSSWGAIHEDITEKVAPVTNTFSHTNIILSGDFKQQAVHYINDHAQTITFIWFLIVFIRSLQLFFSLQGLYRLRYKNIVAVDVEWVERVRELAVKLGIRKLIGIAESGIAKVPMVMGHLKPLILVPVGLLTALSPAEIEAILIHELAHIRRCDYLMNLLQSFMEIIFFFNPAVLWLSSLIRTERENCCDDVVVSQTSSKVNYIKALVSCQEYQLSAPSYAVALTGKRNRIIGRVKRMLSGRNHALNIRERAILFITILSAGILTVAFTKGDKIDEIVRNTVSNVKQVVLQDKKTNHDVLISPNIAKIEYKEPDTLANSRENKEPAISEPDIPAEVAEPDEPAGEAAKMAVNDSLAAVAEQDRFANENARIRLMSQLVTDGVVKRMDDLESFKLSTEEFIVNNKKQPDEIYQKYRKEYVKITGHNTWTWYYNYDTSAETK